MEIVNILKISIIFLIGFLIASLLNYYFLYGLETPFLQNFTVKNNAPSDIIKENQIEILKDKVIIHVENPSISRYAPTGSMKPLLDKGANGIRIKPKTPEDVNIGDIVSFKNNNQLIVHRVVYKGFDEKGIYYITKGDNNSVVDGIVRFEDIEYVTIAIIW